MVTFELTPKMRMLAPPSLGRYMTAREDHKDWEVNCDVQFAHTLIHHFAELVNRLPTFMNRNKANTSALAAIKRIRKALELKPAADFAKNPNLRGR